MVLLSEPLGIIVSMNLWRAGLILAALVIDLQGQQKPAELQFEVASVRPVPPHDVGARGIGLNGGPGTKNPGRFTTTNSSLSDLLMEAYNVRRYQIIGPAWMATERFDVNAKVPAGATKEQFRLMLQNLLEERFQVVTHRETKESQVFELLQAKGGHKLKEYVEDPAAAATRVRAGGMAMRIGAGGNTKLEATGMPVGEIVRMLSNYLRMPVVDATGLTGKYNVDLQFSAEGLAGGPAGDRAMQATPGVGAGGDWAPTLFSAVQEQLGLKLERKKGTVEVIVVDRAVKTPTAN
jgi:uncharacterized protein (TIGR03435 family)